MADEKRSAVLVLLLNELVDSDDEKPTRGKTREWIKRREQNGYFNNIIKELKIEDRFGFREMFRMDVGDFEFILNEISHLITPGQIRNCGGHRPIMPEERLALTLRFLATGESFQSLHFQFRIALNAISYIIRGCCNALVDKLVPKFLKLPSSEKEWLEIAKNFETRWNYPHALGAIDGKHVTIKKPANCGSYYYNYKHTHSIILLAIAGPNYECLYADVGSNGRVNDSGVWNNSSLLQSIQDGSVKLPKDDELAVSGVTLPYVFVGDDAFALKKFMMKPYPQQNLTVDRRIYNYRHSRARRISENLFGILANRWRIFFTTINLEPKYVENLVLSTLALHNMLIKNPAYRSGNLADSTLENGDVREGEWRDNVTTDTFHPLQIPRSGHNASATAKVVRDEFKDYFMNEGAVEWQWKFC